MDTTAELRELDAVRQRRAELRETPYALEQALVNDTDLLDPLRRLQAEFELHVEVTEGEGGLHRAILAGDLRLTNQVAALARDHPLIAADIAAALESPGEQIVRELIARLVAHRKRGADLVYVAFSQDLGGGD